MSTTKFATMTNTAATRTVAVMVGKSYSVTAPIANLPSPGKLKMYSVMTAPPSKPARSKPAEVTIGVKPARKACLRKTTRSESPLALAVRM